MKTPKWSTAHLSKLAGLSAIALIAAGCGDSNAANQTAPEAGDTATNKSVAQNFEDVGAGVSNTAGNMADAAGNVAEAAGNQVAGAGNAVAGAGAVVVKGARNADDALIQTPKVKAAILNNAAMKGAMGLNVTSSDKNVTLTGTVKTQQQKTLAGNIAKKNSPGYNVINNLKVAK